MLFRSDDDSLRWGKMRDTSSSDSLSVAKPLRRTLRHSGEPIVIMSVKRGGRTSNDRIIHVMDVVEQVFAPTLVALMQREELQALSTKDALTGLFNRRLIAEKFDELSAYADREERVISVVMIDIDRFKEVNDSCGHLVGDRVLQNLASQLNQLTRSTDVAFRFGGDEFVLMAVTRTEGDVLLILERLRAGLMDPHGDSSVPAFTISIGIASRHPHSEAPWSEYVAAADAALYSAKTSGRDRIVTATSPSIDGIR